MLMHAHKRAHTYALMRTHTYTYAHTRHLLFIQHTHNMHFFTPIHTLPYTHNIHTHHTHAPCCTVCMPPATQYCYTTSKRLCRTCWMTWLVWLPWGVWSSATQHKKNIECIWIFALPLSSSVEQYAAQIEKVIFRLHREMHRALSLLPRNKKNKVFHTELISFQTHIAYFIFCFSCCGLCGHP